MNNYYQFEVCNVNLNPAKGSEQKGYRPCVVLQTNAVNDVCSTVLIAPLTSQKTQKVYPHQVKINPSVQNGLKVDSKLKLDQTRVVDKKRIIKKIGRLEKKYFEPILNSLLIIFDFNQDFIN